MLLIRASHSIDTAAAQLKMAGFEFTPFVVAHTKSVKVNLPSTGHIIVTSRAAVQAIPTAGTYTIHCVNEMTAEAAKAHIVTTKHKIGIIGTQNAQTLAADIIAAHTPPELFHHLTTMGAQTDWYKDLTTIGHGVQRHLAYTTEYVDGLTPDAATALVAGEPLILCSAKSAEHLLFLAKAANISLLKCTAYCLSEQIAAVVRPQVMRTHTADKPLFSSLIETIQTT